MMNFLKIFLDFFILALNEEEIANVTKLVSNLRFLNFRVDFNKKLFNSFAKAFKNSTKWKAKYLIFKEKINHKTNEQLKIVKH